MIVQPDRYRHRQRNRLRMLAQRLKLPNDIGKNQIFFPRFRQYELRNRTREKRSLFYFNSQLTVRMRIFNTNADTRLRITYIIGIGRKDKLGIGCSGRKNRHRKDISTQFVCYFEIRTKRLITVNIPHRCQYDDSSQHIRSELPFIPYLEPQIPDFHIQTYKRIRHTACRPTSLPGFIRLQAYGGRYNYRTAMHSISTSAPFGNALTATAERAG